MSLIANSTADDSDPFNLAELETIMAEENLEELEALRADADSWVQKKQQLLAKEGSLTWQEKDLLNGILVEEKLSMIMEDKVAREQRSQP